MFRRRLAAVALAALTAALFAVPGAASGAQADDQALVRVAHFAPGLLKGDVYVVYVNGRLQLKGVPYKTVSDYLKVKPGKFKVEVREAGEPVDSPPVVAATVDLEAGKAYTVAVYGQLTSVKAALLTDDMSRPASNKSKVRLIQAIPGEGAVDLVTGGDVLISNARFPSASDYQEVPAGSVDAEVRKAGSDEVLARASDVPSRRWSRSAASARSSSCSSSATPPPRCPPPAGSQPVPAGPARAPARAVEGSRCSC